MNDRETMTGPSEVTAVAAAVRAGDESAFGALAERHRRELLVHCYRMLGSFQDAEDAVQDALLTFGPEVFGGLGLPITLDSQQGAGS